jgi:hypothetical protein
MPVVVCLPEYRRGWVAHDQQGSKVPSTMYCRPVTSSSATGTKRASARAIRGVTVEMALLIVDCETE